MQKTSPPIHVTFGASAAGSLKMALRTLGRSEEVLHLSDDLAYGPINPPEPRLRAAWSANELGEDEDPKLIAHIEEFWSRVAGLRTDVVAWMSRRYATEYCGLLELLSRIQVPISLIDVAEIEFRGLDGAPSPDTSMAFGFVGDPHIVEHNLFDRAIHLSSTARDAYLAEWQTLRDENAALRALTSKGLTSAPITHFDDTIISCVTSEWQSCARVVGESLFRTSPGPFRQGGGDTFLFSRLLTLIDEGVLEGRNEQELWSMRESWVRR